MERNAVCVRKGAWTKEEDILLRECIDKYGVGRWHLVPLRAGVNRCRKSCRLRWLNYLSPNIKRGLFARDEVDLIVRLHKLLGNRWSLIAGRIPGRTANDVKNFWNTYVDKKPSPPSTSTPKERSGPPNETTTITKSNIVRPRPRVFSGELHAPPPCPLELMTNQQTEDEEIIGRASNSTMPLMSQNVEPSSVQSSADDDQLIPEKDDECLRWWSSLLDISETGAPFLFPEDEEPGQPVMISPRSPDQVHRDDGGSGNIDLDAELWEFLNMDNN